VCTHAGSRRSPGGSLEHVESTDVLEGPVIDLQPRVREHIVAPAGKAEPDCWPMLAEQVSGDE
jgi:hypothetical protein